MMKYKKKSNPDVNKKEICDYKGAGKCSVQIQHEHVKVEQKSRKAIFSNVERKKFWKIEVDGCLVTDEQKPNEKTGKAADYIVAKENSGEIIVELKGKGVGHAFKQIEETAELWLKRKIGSGKIAGLIVCNRCPAETTGFQNQKDSFRKKYKGHVHISNGNYEYEFESVFTPNKLKKNRIGD